MTDLIWNSVEIRNFRAFRHLRIEKLGRVNLITGKNNVGKSSLLELLWIYARLGDPRVILEELIARDELDARDDQPFRNHAREIQERVSGLKHLFHGHQNIKGYSDVFSIGSTASPDEVLSFHVDVTTARGSISQASNSNLPNTTSVGVPVPQISIGFGNAGRANYPLNLDYFGGLYTRVAFGTFREVDGFFVSASGLSAKAVGDLWDKVVLTPLEMDVLNALRIIAPKIQAVSFVASYERTRGRIPIATVEGIDGPVPLGSMGDGINRLFSISLALVNAENGLLLLDEVETGIHYSVLPDVWRLLFAVAKRLNVQVFATTHSWDCIQAFQQAASDNTEVEGQLVRLTREDDDVIADLFSERDLKIVTENAIEVR